MASHVTDFYHGKNVFITGGTGFVGICLIEKLLRCCPDVKSIYLLIRPKKGKQIAERLEELTKNSVSGAPRNLVVSNVCSPRFPDSRVGREQVLWSVCCKHCQRRGYEEALWTIYSAVGRMLTKVQQFASETADRWQKSSCIWYICYTDCILIFTLSIEKLYIYVYYKFDSRSVLYSPTSYLVRTLAFSFCFLLRWKEKDKFWTGAAGSAVKNKWISVITSLLDYISSLCETWA